MKRILTIAGALTFALSMAVSAAELRFDLLEARWDNPVGGNVTSIDDTFGDPVTVTWAAGTNSNIGVNASGYDFNARPTPFTEAPDDVFALGSFTHFNQPITAGTAITSVDLFLTGTITSIFEGMETLIGSKTFDFTFLHDETPNGADPCVYADDGSDPLGDVNRNGCADRVDVSAVAGTDTFTVDGVEYTLNILGFSNSLADANNGIFTQDFLSAEGSNNNRVLAAAFTADIPTPIPLPASVWLLASGVGLLGGFKKLSNRKKA